MCFKWRCYKNSTFFALFRAKLISFRRCNQPRERKWGVIRKRFRSFVSQSWPQFRLEANAYTASLRLKCDQDWLKDEEVENREVITIKFFGGSALVRIHVETSSFIKMKLDKNTHTNKGFSQQWAWFFQVTITLLLTGMFCSAFPQCCWPRRMMLTSCRECYHFTKINWRLVCTWMQLASGNNNQ